MTVESIFILMTLLTICFVIIMTVLSIKQMNKEYAENKRIHDEAVAQLDAWHDKVQASLEAMRNQQLNKP